MAESHHRRMDHLEHVHWFTAEITEDCHNSPVFVTVA